MASTEEVQWRRRWKPDLKARPWQRLQMDDQPYLVKFNFQPDAYEIMISDFVGVWCESLDADSIKKRTKKINPSVEAPLGKLLDHIRESIEGANKRKGTELSVATKELGDGEHSLLLTMNSKLAGLPFTWKFRANPGDADMVSEHLTVPLLAMVGELNRRQRELFKLLQNKDREIADYKAQGSRVSRKHLETIPFEESAFHNDMVVSKDFEAQVSQLGASAFDSQGGDLYVQIMTKHAWLHSGPQPALEGESLMDDGSVEPATTVGQSWGNKLPPSLAHQGASQSVSPKKSPVGSPAKSPASSRGQSSPDVSPEKNTELLRRQALERKLAEEEGKKEQKNVKKKKKMKF